MRLTHRQSNLLKTILSGSVLFSLIVGFLCIDFIHAASAHAENGTGHAIHTSHEAQPDNCCDAGVSDHMELWLSTFVGIPQFSQDFLVLIVLAVATTFAFASFLPIPRLEASILFSQYRQYAREHPNILARNHLRLAFSRGILHPKTF